MRERLEVEGIGSGFRGAVVAARLAEKACASWFWPLQATAAARPALTIDASCRAVTLFES